MFASMFKALKRIKDLTIAPMIMAALALLLEYFMSGVTWVFIKIADTVIVALGRALAAIPFPAINVNEGFTSLTLDLAEITGIWLALKFWVVGAILALITRILSFGLIGGK